jgi:hypothetical protein
MESRAKAFASWLGELGFDDKSLKTWDTVVATAMVSAFVHFVAEGGLANRRPGTSNRNKAQLSAQTLMGYARAAEHWCLAVLNLNLSDALDSKKGSIHPFIQEVVTQRRAWERPKGKKEPITLAMYDNAQKTLELELQKSSSAFISRPAAVHDWTCLGVFTGSRVGEYGQSGARRGVVNTIPDSADAGEWASMPLAFIRSDFTFWSKHGQELSRSDPSHLRKHAAEVYVRFRYDKSLNNFTIRKFKRTTHRFLCPVLASTAILLRAQLLGVPANKPVGVFRLKKATSGFTYITNSDVTDELRATCLRTYPDKSHYMNIHHKCIMAHSVRVTAAVALYMAGESYETIAFRLRWSVDSVRHYIRECCQKVGDLCDAVLRGAGRL